jgi:cyclopropane fatty-acyl-phospholipid synthase-like methyltransferase
MENRRHLESFIHWFINIIVYPFFFLIYFYRKNCWRISISEANKLGFNQISDATEENRYPEIFDYIKNLTSNNNAAFILSFGCSYGPECKSLRYYFPNAFIIGYDIFEKNINIAIKENNDNKTVFTASWENVKEKKGFDIVFAMSVLCRTPHTLKKKDISKIYPFLKFEEQISQLDTIIRKDGLLVIYNANFQFTDTNSSQKYEPLIMPNFYDSGCIPKFDKNNMLLRDQKYPYSVFRKIM